MIQIGMLGIMGALLCLILKKNQEEYALCLAVVLGIIIFGASLSKLKEVFSFVETILEKMSLSFEILKPLIKILGIYYLATFTCNLCKDVKQEAIASVVMLFAKISMIVVSIPTLTYFLEVLEGFLP
ncbi:MAG: stage III sporulation AC/AD family protein [Agathobacter sp.]|nr:stage III sporulation AC/AD family protein [Agathobacter sp.]